MKYFFLIQIFYENHPPIRHTKFIVIDFASSNKSIRANELPSANLERYLRRILISAYALIVRTIALAYCPKLAKMAIFKPP